MNVCPITMVKNEALYIRQVLRPLLAVCGFALVGDTGSTDGTAELAEAAGATVVRFGPQTPHQLGQVRKLLGDRAQALGYEWGLCVDGDELWSVEGLQMVVDEEMPAGKRCGFITMQSIDYKDGEAWELGDWFSRLAVYRLDDEWKGEYPFEWPASWQPISEGRASGHYIACPPGWTKSALHLHRLQRSPADAEVYRRQEKQFQFSMREANIPFVRRLEEPWLTLLKPD